MMRSGNHRDCLCGIHSEVLVTKRGGPGEWCVCVCVCVQMYEPIEGAWSESSAGYTPPASPPHPPSLHPPPLPRPLASRSYYPVLTHTSLPDQRSAARSLSVSTYSLLEWITRETLKSVGLCFMPLPPTPQFACLCRIRCWKCWDTGNRRKCVSGRDDSWHPTHLHSPNSTLLSGSRMKKDKLNEDACTCLPPHGLNHFLALGLQRCSKKCCWDKYFLLTVNTEKQLLWQN